MFHWYRSSRLSNNRPAALELDLPWPCFHLFQNGICKWKRHRQHESLSLKEIGEISEWFGQLPLGKAKGIELESALPK
jgi:hypothetical protein